jgi:hypothetical protein
MLQTVAIWRNKYIHIINSLTMNLKDLIKNNVVKFDSYRRGIFYYTIIDLKEKVTYIFTVPADDIGTATLMAESKAITFMRWIRKAIINKTLVRGK